MLKKKKFKRSNGVGYYPFPVMCRDTIVVSRQEGRGVHDRRACAHDQGPARSRAGMLGEAGRDRSPGVLCCDREFSVTIELSHPVS